MSQKRVQLVETAASLFSSDGYQTTGIDNVLKSAGVAKMTMYSHFGSKDELISAAVDHLGEKRFEDFFERVKKSADNPKGQLRMIFPVLEELSVQDGVVPCPFLRAVTEYSGDDHAAKLSAVAHKKKILNFIFELARAAKMDDPKTFAVHVMILMEGAMNLFQFFNTRTVFRAGHSQMQDLIELG